LAAVKTLVFEERSLSAQRLLDALDTNFEQDEVLRRKLFDEAPKVGNDDARADAMLVKIFGSSEKCES